MEMSLIPRRIVFKKTLRGLRRVFSQVTFKENGEFADISDKSETCGPAKSVETAEGTVDFQESFNCSTSNGTSAFHLLLSSVGGRYKFNPFIYSSPGRGGAL